MTEQGSQTPRDIIQMILDEPQADDAPQTEAELIALIENAPDAFALLPAAAREELFRMQEQGQRTMRQATAESLYEPFG